MFRRLIVALAAAFMVLLPTAAPALAAPPAHELTVTALAAPTARAVVAAPAVPAAAVGDSTLVFTMDPAAVVQLLIAVVLPILVGLITTKVTSGAVKAWLLAGATLVTSLAVELQRALSSGASFDVGVALLAALPAFGISVAMHYGLWKPTGTTAAAQAVGVRETGD